MKSDVIVAVRPGEKQDYIRLEDGHLIPQHWEMISLKLPYLCCNSSFAIIATHLRQILVDESAGILTKKPPKLVLEISESFPKSALPNAVVKLPLNEESEVSCHPVVYGGPKGVPAPRFLAGNKNALRSRSKYTLIKLEQHRIRLNERAKLFSMFDKITPMCRIQLG
jgi:hypothetical protein